MCDSTKRRAESLKKTYDGAVMSDGIDENVVATGVVGQRYVSQPSGISEEKSKVSYYRGLRQCETMALRV